MLLLCFFFLFLNHAHGYPIPFTGSEGLTADSESTLSYSIVTRGLANSLSGSSGNSNNCDCLDTRNLREILWSCAATLVFATWVSVHLNLPPRGLSPFRSILVRIGAMFISILAPEATLHWAYMEWLVARDLTRQMVEQFPDKQWTMTHSFYVVMGGFALHDKKEDILRPVHPAQFMDRLQAGEFLFPKITQEEIADKSKGDGLTKSVAIVQILWFAIRLVTRFGLRWAAADVEVLTLGTCVVMLLVYGFWWHKPLSVHCQTELEPGPRSTSFQSPLELPLAIVPWSPASQSNSQAQIPKAAPKISAVQRIFRSKRQPRHWVHEMIAWRIPESDITPSETSKWNPLRILRLFPIIVVFPSWLLLGFMHPILHGMATIHPVDEWEDSANPVGPPKFFEKPLLCGHLVLLISCACFSSLHFISSNSHTSYTSPKSISPNHFESMFFFSFCSTMMVCGPLLILLLVWIYWIAKLKPTGLTLAEVYSKMSRWTAIFLLVHASLRLVVVLLSLFLLSRLPQSAFRELSWSDAIPFV